MSSSGTNPKLAIGVVDDEAASSSDSDKVASKPRGKPSNQTWKAPEQAHDTVKLTHQTWKPPDESPDTVKLSHQTWKPPPPERNAEDEDTDIRDVPIKPPAASRSLSSEGEADAEVAGEIGSDAEEPVRILSTPPSSPKLPGVRKRTPLPGSLPATKPGTHPGMGPAQPNAIDTTPLPRAPLPLPVAPTPVTSPPLDVQQTTRVKPLAPPSPPGTPTPVPGMVSTAFPRLDKSVPIAIPESSPFARADASSPFAREDVTPFPMEDSTPFPRDDSTPFPALASQGKGRTAQPQRVNDDTMMINIGRGSTRTTRMIIATAVIASLLGLFAGYMIWGFSAGKSTTASSTAPTPPPTVEEPTAVEKPVVAPAPIKQCTLIVTSKPAKATVSLDGNKLGVTPLEKQLPCEGGDIEISRRGYASATESVKLTADETVAVKLQRPTFKVTIESEPAGATLILNKKAIGPTPQTIEVRGFVSNRVKLQHEGYRTLSTKLTAKEDGGNSSYTLKKSKKKRKKRRR